MAEFAIALLVRRKYEINVFIKGDDVDYKKKVVLESEQTRIRKLNINKTDDIDFNLHPQEGTINPSLANVPKLDAFFDSGARLRAPENLDDNQTNRSFKCFRISSNAIDFTASILFPTFYLIFNILYWCI